MATKNYLMTGDTGFLGKTLKQSFLDSCVQVRSINDKLGRIDITLPFSISSSISIDVVVHAAGKAHVVPKNNREAEEFHKVNYDGTVNLCNAIEESGLLPKMFIFISSVAVYGKECGNLIDESFPLLGSTPYAKSKIDAELYLQDWTQKMNIPLFIFRLPLILGHNPPGNLGAMIHSIKGNRYYSIGKANAKKSIVWAKDIARLIMELNTNHPGIYNLTDGYNPTFLELECAIARCLNKPRAKNIPLVIAKICGKFGDIIGTSFPLNSDKLKKIISPLTFDDLKAQRLLNWTPTPVLKKICEIFV